MPRKAKKKSASGGKRGPRAASPPLPAALLPVAAPAPADSRPARDDAPKASVCDDAPKASVRDDAPKASVRYKGGSFEAALRDNPEMQRMYAELAKRPDVLASLDRFDREEKARLSSGVGIGRIEKILRDAGHASMQRAALDGDIDTVKALVDAGDCIKKGDGSGYTAAYTAAQGGHLDVLRFLADKGADLKHEAGPDDFAPRAMDGSSPTTVAASGGHLHILHFLDERGALNFNASNRGATPTFMAAHNGHIDVLRFLEDKGALSHARAGDESTPVLMAAQNGHLDSVRFLTEKGADIHAGRDGDGAGPMRMAVSNGHLDTLRYLVSKGGRLGDMREDGVTLVMVAASRGFFAVVWYLAQRRCDITLLSHGRSATAFALANGHYDVARFLTDIERAGGYGKYAANLRLPHCRIRYRVGATYAMLPVGNKERELYHLVYGRNDEEAILLSSRAGTSDAGAIVRSMSTLQLKATAKRRGLSLVGCFEKSEIVNVVLAAGPERVMLTLPDEVFAIIVKFLAG